MNLQGHEIELVLSGAVLKMTLPLSVFFLVFYGDSYFNVIISFVAFNVFEISETIMIYCRRAAFTSRLDWFVWFWFFWAHILVLILFIDKS